MKVKLRSKYAEWQILNKWFGNYEMSVVFKDYSSYELVRENSTFQEVYDELKTIIE
jgi:hypothetical protein